jgi:ABC-type multidrug transport system fused ATPase/permease subunit
MKSVKYVNRELSREIKRNSGALLSVLGLMFLIVGFDVIAPWPFKILIDNVLSTEVIDPAGILGFLHSLFPSRDLLGFFAVFVYFSSTFGLAIVEYMKSVYTKRVIKNLTADFSKEAFKNLQTLAIGFYNKQKIGDYIYRLGYDVSALGELIEDGVLPLIISSLYLVVTITIMVLIDMKLAILSIAFLPFLTYGLYSFNKRVAHATQRSEFYNSLTFSFIEETLTHLKIIQAFSQEENKSKAFDRHIDESLYSDSVMYRLDFLLSLLVAIVIALSYSIVMLYGVHAVFAGTLTTGLLIVFIFYLDNLTTPILSIIYSVTSLRESWTKISRMEDFFSTKSHLDYHKGKVMELTGTDITFEHVTLFGDEGKKMLDNLSFTIEAGKSTVIFGASGSGKTSLTNLIMRFIDKPSAGRILIGGTPIEDYDIEMLRRFIGYVPQEITLFDDTIRNNIVFGNKMYSADRLERAAQKAGVTGFVKRLPGGYDFPVGASGGLLSGGQRQRIMLARALMKEEAAILIFDETFSALDVKTRREVLHTVSKFSKDKTSIFISNVFDIITAAENIIVLSHGKLLYSGPARRLPKEISLFKMISEGEPAITEES